MKIQKKVNYEKKKIIKCLLLNNQEDAALSFNLKHVSMVTVRILLRAGLIMRRRSPKFIYIFNVALNTFLFSLPLCQYFYCEI